MDAQRLLAVNADDFGYDPGIDRGILEAAAGGIVTSATVLVTLPGARAALSAAASLPIGVGLHVNLVRGRPLTRARSLCSRGGELAEERSPRADPDEVAAETEAQIAQFVGLAGREPTHLDVHRHAHRHPPVLDGLGRVAAARGLPVRALDADMRARLRGLGVRCTDFFVGEAGLEPYWTRERLLATLASLLPGATELMCHPGHRPEHVATSYSAQREVELASLVDPAARAVLDASGVRLVHFGQLFPRSPDRTE